LRASAFDTVILLTGATEAPVLSAALRAHNTELAIHHAASAAELAALSPRLLRHARLIGFVTSVLVPGRILGALGYGAYNFHPGSPRYPGWMPAHFATYDRAGEFGATAHVMIEKVDAGPIVAVDYFGVPLNTTVAELGVMAYASVARLFWRLAADLATRREPLPELPVRWAGRKTTQRLYRTMCDVPADISGDDLARRIGAFGAGHFDLWPTVTLHGHRFRYCGPDTESPSVVPVAEPVAASA